MVGSTTLDRFGSAKDADAMITAHDLILDQFDPDEGSDKRLTTWYEPVTVFLNAAIDLMPANSPDLCARLRVNIP